MFKQSENTLGRVTQQLSRLEKRDWERWSIVCLTGILVSAGLFAILFRAAFRGDTVHFELTVSRPLVFFFFQAEDGIRDLTVTGVQTCALPISRVSAWSSSRSTCSRT